MLTGFFYDIVKKVPDGFLQRRKGMENLQKNVERYRRNMDLQRKLDESLFEDQERDAWIEKFRNRAVEIQKLSAETEEFLAYLKNLLLQPLTDDDMQILFDVVYNLYWDGYEDYIVLLPIVERLIGFYEQKEEIGKLLLLYGIAFYEECEIRNRADGLQIMDPEYMYRIIALRTHYSTLQENERKRFYTAFYNLIVVAMGNKAISPDDSYHLIQQLQDFWNSEEVQRLDGENEDIRGLMDRIYREWLNVEEQIDDASDETKRFFCETASAYYEESYSVRANTLDVNSEVYAAYLHAQVFLGETTYDIALEKYMKYYRDRLQLLPTDKVLDDDDFYFVINAPLTLERWLSQGSSAARREEVVAFLMESTRDTWYNRLNGHAIPFVNELMAEWCFKLMKYMRTPAEKEDLLFNLLVRRQLPTYLHSIMVKNLAEVIYAEVSRSNPKLFADLPGVKPGDTPEFIRKCALLHDVGKSKITDIVNMQVRRLSDREFQGIRKHPEYGTDMIDTDSDLRLYHDIVIGHHKFYNGKGGYPENFDNTASPFRIVIDLITICDCIDAATDHLGRNYKTAKTIQEVLEELTRDSGVRYNPELVREISESPALLQQLNYITSEGRIDLMYQAYAERMRSED